MQNTLLMKTRKIENYEQKNNQEKVFFSYFISMKLIFFSNIQIENGLMYVNYGLIGENFFDET